MMHNESRAERIPIEAAIKTEELLHLTGAMHRAIGELDRILDKRGAKNTALTAELKRIRDDLNSTLVQIYGY